METTAPPHPGERDSKISSKGKEASSRLPLTAPATSTIDEAIALHRRGEIPRAQTLYEAVLRSDPKHFDALHLLGVIALQQARTESAIRLIGQALESDPGQAIAWSNLGIAQFNTNRPEEALASYARSLQLQPDNVSAFNNQAIVLQSLGRHDEALASCDRALRLKPDYAAAMNTRANVLRALLRYPDALECHDAFLRLAPESPDAFSSRSAVLLDLGRAADALASCDRALQLCPTHADAFYNRGNALRALGRDHDALASYEEALRLRPDHTRALNNQGNALVSLNRHQEALACYEHIARLQPDNGTRHWNESLSRLALGDFELGWRKYEFRWEDSQYKKLKREFAQPLWRGEQPLHGKTILLHAEQGLGDTIQFCRYAGLVAARGATVLLEVPAPLTSLLARLDGVHRIYSRGEALPPFDYHCPLLSLPLAFHTDLHTIPAPPAYLAGAPDRILAWHARLGGKAQPRIGIAWSGSMNHRNDRNRSLPLARFARLLSTRAQFVSLQQELRESDRPALERHPEILHFGADLSDFEDTAALIASMDLVISVDTSVAHLAGAVGKPIWLLLPFSADWRWLLERSDSPWYPSARLFRQPAIGDWDSVIAAVAGEINRRFK